MRLGEDAARPCRSASTRELNVESLEALGSFTRSKPRRPLLARPVRASARGADRCWSLRLAGDDSGAGFRRLRWISLRPWDARKSPGVLSSGAAHLRPLSRSRPRLSGAGGKGLGSEVPCPKLSRQPGPLLYSGSRRWPSEQPPPHCPPLQESSHESVRGRSPRAPPTLHTRSLARARLQRPCVCRTDCIEL